MTGIQILTSGASLGVHVPGLILRRRLRERDIDSDIWVLENLLPEQKQASVVKSKWAFHRNFRLALAGQRLAASPLPVLDEAAVRTLLREWKQRSVSHFAVFSGYWLPLLHDYRSGTPWPVRIDLCRLDAAPMSSFEHGGPAPAGSRDICLADLARLTLPWTIPIATSAPVSWGDRNGRVLAHGGGWGIGTYRARIDELPASLGVDVLAYESVDVDHSNANFRFFMMDPEWHPWLDTDYPPLGQVFPDTGCPIPAEYARGGEYPPLFDLTRRALAIISKPGGGTILDSVWSATPIVLLEPFTKSEASNASLWEALGFGISFEKWRATGFATAVLEELHENLVPAARAAPDYVSALADELGIGAG
jgi:hypothetical protein